MSEDNPTLSSPSSPVAPATGSKTKYEFFKVVQKYMDDACTVLDVPEYVRTILSQPKTELMVNFPVRMDDGWSRLFKG